MTQEEKKLLSKAQLEVDQILLLQDPGACSGPQMKDRCSFEQLLSMLDVLRVFTKYTLMDLEATRREKADLAKALKDKQ